jgi:hypothetical protein
MSKTRAVRLSDKEERQIEEFLNANPFFDFSTLARMAILEFIKNPKITIQPIKQTSQRKDRKSSNGYL